ncbi:MAG: hypothetical protein V3T53_12890 [Phycisphaerales bacterium]
MIVVVGVVVVVMRVVVVVQVVVAMQELVAARVVLVAGAVNHKLVDGSTAVTSRIGFTPPRYISCGRCARRTPAQG